MDSLVAQIANFGSKVYGTSDGKPKPVVPQAKKSVTRSNTDLPPRRTTIIYPNGRREVLDYSRRDAWDPMVRRDIERLERFDRGRSVGGIMISGPCGQPWVE